MIPDDRYLSRRQALPLAALSIVAFANVGRAEEDKNLTPAEKPQPMEETTPPMRIHYLEIVTKEVDAVCALYSQLHGGKFGEADQNLGGARTLKLANGGVVGVRAPMHDSERPVTRPYLMVDDIEAAVAAAEKSGAQIALPPLPIPGHGTCAIYFLGGVEFGLWQVEKN